MAKLQILYKIWHIPYSVDQNKTAFNEVKIDILRLFPIYINESAGKRNETAA